MQSRAIHRLLATCFVGLFALPAVAQYTRDTSANLKIDEAINDHYLMMELDKSENLLTGVVKACDDKCTAQTKAKAWMYVGIVRGSGKSDQAGAKEAFVTAKALDPAVALDRDLASTETQATFDAVPGGVAPKPTTATPTTPTTAAEIPGDMICTPEARNIQTRMPIPVSCTSDAAVASAEIKFKEFGSDQWKKTSMRKVGEFWQAELPCDVTGTAGPLHFYIGAKDAAGEYVDQYGSKKQPATIQLTDAASAAPSYPGQAPVTRCAETSDCPPNFPGCNSGAQQQQCGDLDWGASCSASSQCQCGLVCSNGACENAPSCTSDSECDSGSSCVNGSCSAAPESNGPYSKHWLGIDIGQDLVSIGGSGLCTADRVDGYGSECFDANGQPTNDPRPGVSGAGLAMGQLRFKLGYDFALTENLTIGARVGVGFMNTRPDFLPVSAEARVNYNFTSLAKGGFRPYLYLSGGLAEVNGRIRSLGVDIYKFNSPPIIVTPGLGFVYAIQPNLGIRLDAGAVITIGPTPNFALQPNLGFVYGL